MSQLETKSATVEDLIDMAKLKAAQGDLDTFKDIVKLFPLDQIDTDQGDNLMVLLLNAAQDSDTVLKYIFEVWKDVEYNASGWDVYTYALRFNINDTVANKIPSLSDKTFIEHAISIIDDDGSTQNLEALRRLFKIYGKQTKGTILGLVDYVNDQERDEGYGNRNAKNFILDQLKEYDEYAQVPEWIDLKVADKEPVVKEFKGTDTQIHEARAKLKDDVNLFRYYGPVNPHVNMDLSETHPCSIYGGCRMFVCQEFDMIDPSTNDISDEYNTESGEWFTGICDYIQCSKRIEKPQYAVRRPIELGGWEGCYCSWNHVRLNIPDNQANTILSRMIEVYEEQLKKYKISDY